MTEGQIIEAARVASGLTQRDVATKLGYTSAQFVSNWERGLARVPKAAMKKLGKLIGKRPMRELIELRVDQLRSRLTETLN